MENTTAMPPGYDMPPNNRTPTGQTSGASHEFNTALGSGYSIFTDYMGDMPYSVRDIQGFAKNPMYFNRQLRELAWWAYRSNGSVTSAVDYMRSMHTLDGVPVCKSRGLFGKKPRHFNRNRELFISTMNTIRYKQFIRDALLKDANDGICFYYFETVKAPPDRKKFLSDLDVMNTVELNQAGVNATIISLPVDWCKIVGIHNNSYVGAFNLRYFEQFNESDLRRKLTQFPKQIRDAWTRYSSGAVIEPWAQLDNTKTIITKIKSARNEPYGIPLAICALDDILYAEYFQNTKRAVLDKLNNVIIYETFPEGRDKVRLSADRQISV